MDEFKRRLLGASTLSPVPGPWALRSPIRPTVHASSPTFNLPPKPLAKGERGLVVSGPVKVAGDAVSLQVGPNMLDPQELRFSLLFWDRLDYPENRILHMPLGPDEEYLASAAILQRTGVQLVGSFSGTDVILHSHIGTFRALENREPGRWSMARGERSISFPPEEALKDKGLLFALHQCIPVPDKEVPLAEILEFRVQRAAELAAVRSHLEEVFQGILAAPDRPVAEVTRIEALERAIADHIKVSLETGFALRLGDLKAGITLFDVNSAMVAGTAAFAVGLPLLESMIVGAVSGAVPKVALKTDIGLKGKKVSTTPFEYISAYHRDLFRR